ncbi:O-antigen ligase family protein [Corallincola holothuriorum]|uniref:O-antigen ligase family protein n=1 Tax=Corallincola holothuriorum TaxID=2282215 RepID=A0A368NFP1_9GAMM|nr:O-antigen ligase family protein [Corallincola holothuriorum]
MLFLLIWLPLPLGSNRLWAWSIIEILTFSILLSAIALCYFNYHHYAQRLKKFYPLWLSLSALPVVAIIQIVLNPSAALPVNAGSSAALYTEDIARTKSVALLGISYIAFSFCIAFFTHSPRRLRLIATALVCSAVLQVLYAATLLFSGLEKTPIFAVDITDRASGSFIYHNHLANYLLLCGSFGIGLMISQFKNRYYHSTKVKMYELLRAMTGRKMVLRSGLILIVIGIVLTRSRMGNVAFFTSLLFTSLIALTTYKSRPKALVYFIISLLIVDILVVGSLVGLKNVEERIKQTSITAESRDEVIQQALPMISENPLLGFGAGSFYTAFNRFQQTDVGGFYDHAHNDYLQIAVEYGLPALGIVSISVLFALILCVQTMRTRQSQTMKGLAFGICMAIIGMLIHSFVDFNLQAPANALTFITLLTLAVTVRYMPQKGWSKQ